MNLPDVVRHPLQASTTALDGPSRVVVDASGTSSLRGTLASFEEAAWSAHFTLDPAGRAVLQHLPTSKAAWIRKTNFNAPNRIGKTVWVVVAKAAGTALSEEDSRWVGEVVGKIAVSNKVPLEVAEFPPAAAADPRSEAMATAEWSEFSGICAAMSVPALERFGPGVLDADAFLEGVKSAKEEPKKKSAKKKAAPKPKPEPEPEPEPVEEETPGETEEAPEPESEE